MRIVTSGALLVVLLAAGAPSASAEPADVVAPAGSAYMLAIQGMT